MSCLDSYEQTYFQIQNGADMIYKGTQRFLDSHSCFSDIKGQVQDQFRSFIQVYSQNLLKQNPTKLRALLLQHDIIDVFLCGLAIDGCIGKSRIQNLEELLKSMFYILYTNNYIFRFFINEC